MTDEAQDYIDEMFRQRGYILDFHKVLAAEDLAFLKSYNELVEAAYTEATELDALTKELLYVVALTAVKGSVEHIKTHVKLALDYGASKGQVLGALKIALLTAGVPAFMLGFEAWKQTVKPGSVEPSRRGR